MLLAALSLSGCDRQQGLKIGDAAPGFSVTDVSGEQVSLSRLNGKIVLLYFWTNSCCGAGLKAVEPFYRANRDHLEVVAINEGDAGEVVAAYARNNGVTFPLVTDERSQLFERYHVVGFPTLFLIDRQGVIREKILGPVQPARLEKLIQRRLEMQQQAGEAYEKTHRR